MAVHRREFARITLGMPALGWLGCAPRGAVTDSRPLRISAARRLSMSSLYLALESGYFRQLGLDVRVHNIGNSSEALPLLAGGGVDVFFHTVTPSFINAVAKGARVKIVASREIASSTCGHFGSIYGTRESFPGGLADLKHLKGKRIAIGRTIGLTEFALDLHLLNVGLSRNDVDVVLMRHPDAVAALVGGEVDAIVSHEEYDTDLAGVSSRIIRSIGLAEILPNFQYSFVAYGRTLLDGNPGPGSKFLAAYLRAAREFLGGKTPRFMEDFSRSNGLDVDAVLRGCRETFVPDGRIDLKSLEYYVNWAAKKGYCPMPVEAAQLVDTRFLDEAHRLLGGQEEQELSSNTRSLAQRRSCES